MCSSVGKPRLYLMADIYIHQHQHRRTMTLNGNFEHTGAAFDGATAAC